jgi:hypothetical protein
MIKPLISIDAVFHDGARICRDLPILSPSQPDDLPQGDAGQIDLPRLVPTRPPAGRDWFLQRLKAFRPDRFVSSPSSGINATALKAGLFLWHDYLDESHAVAQSIEGEGLHQLGDYWHAILHRREPDYANAKYWFRHVGRQPIFGDLAAKAGDILNTCSNPDAAPWRDRLLSKSGWDPFAFVDLCEACADDELADLSLAARQIQLVEMALLLEFTRNLL